MAVTYFPMDSGAGVAVQQAQWQKMARNWFSTGVVRNALGTDLQVAAPGVGMSVNVGAGRAIIEGFFMENSATAAVAIASADPTNPRIDYIIVQLDLSGHTMSLQAVTGTPAGVPPLPTLTNNGTVYQMVLAQVAVGAAVGVINAGNVTDQRTYGNAVMGGIVTSAAAPADMLGFGLNGSTDVGIMAQGHTGILGGGNGAVMKTNNYVGVDGIDRFITSAQQAAQWLLTGNAAGLKVSTNTPTANAAITWGTTRYF